MAGAAPKGKKKPVAKRHAFILSDEAEKAIGSIKAAGMDTNRFTSAAIARHANDPKIKAAINTLNGVESEKAPASA